MTRYSNNGGGGTGGPLGGVTYTLNNNWDVYQEHFPSNVRKVYIHAHTGSVQLLLYKNDRREQTTVSAAPCERLSQCSWGFPCLLAVC